MISRVAQSCFWLTRYLERVDALARLLDVHHALHIDAAAAATTRWRPVLRATGQEASFVERLGDAAVHDGEAVEGFVTWDADDAASLWRAVGAARENARTVRDVMSLEAWEAINDLWLWINRPAARRLFEKNRGSFYEHLIQSTVLFHGVSHGTMLHDEPFTFMKLGRADERAAQTARILDAHVAQDAGPEGGAADASRWLSALRSCCAYDPFFRGASHALHQTSVARFLVFDQSFPRSVLYNLDETRTLLRGLRKNDPFGLPRRSRTALERARGELLQMDMADVERRGLHSTLNFVIRATDHLCDAIRDDYLEPPQAWLRHCVRVLESLERAPEAERAA